MLRTWKTQIRLVQLSVVDLTGSQPAQIRTCEIVSKYRRKDVGTLMGSGNEGRIPKECVALTTAVSLKYETVKRSGLLQPQMQHGCCCVL